MRKAENELVFTEPRFTEPHETRAAAAIAPPDDIDEGDDGARTKPRFATDFREGDADDGFLKWQLWLRDNLLDERAFILDVVNEFIAEKLEQRDAQIRTLELKLAELHGQLNQVNANERGPAGPRGERGVKGPRGRQGRKGDPGLSPRVPMIKGWVVDKKRYVATPVMSDNTCGASIELLDLFKTYNEQTTT